MKNKLLLATAMICTSFSVLAGAPVDPIATVPEPSILGLFAAAAIAVTIAAKLKK
ncbi:PEP-CTERM sorting domain-containing protein [Neptunomonas qingdaonensis]|uniref:PEP-CTERM protein-sorting domain-containing protein n=1 Tax=Neptunomonas qingdaonensis TaxID=1045558 RepID=A0A1I2S8A3_9GAMM|nr:PEP-CTERM sorting domain-containing protein [Neptunomonas qingdaonensis]SFG47929.1 PEP-CTERM protein-sorting domain-containing protein [Neptunomonas qingdaonensis]